MLFVLFFCFFCWFLMDLIWIFFGFNWCILNFGWNFLLLDMLCWKGELILRFFISWKFFIVFSELFGFVFWKIFVKFIIFLVFLCIMFLFVGIIFDGYVCIEGFVYFGLVWGMIFLFLLLLDDMVVYVYVVYVKIIKKLI